MSPSVSSSTGNKVVSKAGITVTEDGKRHIPASTRSDGTVRKEIKVRPGYRPPEDVEVYKNRTAQAWKDRGSGGVPGAETVGGDTTTSVANKNAKRREARKKAAANKDGDEKADDESKETDGSLGNGKSVESEAVIAEALDPEAEKAKEARKLSKKLRQARELKDKKEKGDALLPEQFEKVIKINELIRQLDKLGFDADGEKKDASG